MHVNDILITQEPPEMVQLISERCSNFIVESDRMPLFKNLPKEYSDFHRVKVRHRKVDALGEAMNMAFKNEDQRLAQRAIFTSGYNNPPQHTKLQEYLEPFYIFPIDGYHFIYNKEIKETLNLVDLNPIIEEFGLNKGIETIADVLKFSYTQNNLCEGIRSGSEIILYGIPFYYALRASTVESYDDLLTAATEI